jgi:DNA anti-recombination protein RmuC
MAGNSFATDAVAVGRGDGNADNIEVLRASLRGLAEVVTTEQAERRQLEDQVKMLMRANDECSSKLRKLQTTLQQRLDQVEDKLTTTDGEYKAAWGALENKVETYNDEVEDRVNQIAKTLVSASRDAKERSEAVEREFYERLDASAILIEEQAAKVDTRFATERKAVADKWDAVERNLAIRMEPLEARLVETRSSLTRMLEDANRVNDASRERQQKLLSEQSAKLRQQITEGNVLLTDRVEKSLSDNEEWVKKALEDVVQLLKRGNSNLKDEVSAVDKRCTAAIDDQAKTREASEARLKDEIKGARMELRELVKATKEDLERADSNQATEINATIQTVADDLAYDLETNKHLLEAAEEGLNAKLIEEASARQSLEQDFTNKLGQSVHLLGNVIDGTKAELVEKLDTLSQKVDVDMKAQMANLETSFYERLDDLKTQVVDKVAKSTDEMAGKMDTMNVRIKKVTRLPPYCLQHLSTPLSFDAI